MSVKRNRPGSSSSHLATPTRIGTSSATPAKIMKAESSADSSRAKNIFTVASPETIGAPDQMKSDGFLERCHFCKKRIAQNSEIFMYSDLCAFCSAECRDNQIALDQSAEKHPEG
ncbi:hypothetical protein ACJIZ3_016782 [Penstemon smallii]|uniref:FLZ-type domain-containing protein n=1 Tax=Penstemon smallii TaxID=265156 RepID=A0ABD3SUF2_9LAMI